MLAWCKLYAPCKFNFLCTQTRPSHIIQWCAGPNPTPPPRPPPRSAPRLAGRDAASGAVPAAPPPSALPQASRTSDWEANLQIENRCRSEHLELYSSAAMSAAACGLKLRSSAVPGQPERVVPFTMGHLGPGGSCFACVGSSWHGMAGGAAAGAAANGHPHTHADGSSGSAAAAP